MISFATPDARDEIQEARDSGPFRLLVGNARRGCPVARSQLCELFRPFVTRLAKRMIPVRLRAKVEPEDLAQDVLFEFYCVIDRFAGQEEAQIQGWLYRATMNRGRDLLRRFGPGSKRDVARERQLGAPSDYDAARSRLTAHCDCPCQQAIQAELCREIEAAIGRLALDQRHALELALDGRRSYADAACELGRSSEAVRKLCARARAQLKRELHTSALPG